MLDEGLHGVEVSVSDLVGARGRVDQNKEMLVSAVPFHRDRVISRLKHNN